MQKRLHSNPASYVASLPTELQDLHRRANRVAKVAMQDIKLLRPADVQTGRENKDICVRLRGELDKAHKEYDRRFRAIQEIRWIISITGWWKSLPGEIEQPWRISVPLARPAALR